VVTIPNYQIENLRGMIDAVSRPRRVSGEAKARNETAPARR
jgi:hypothetical protein